MVSSPTLTMPEELFSTEAPAKPGGFAHDRDLENGKEEWLTPPEIIRALGDFDLDPCSPTPDKRPWSTAREHFDIRDSGLLKPWHGRVWCNPPYGPKTGEWLARCAEHGNCVCLIFARTETRAFFDSIWPKATAVLFLRGRLSFYLPARLAALLVRPRCSWPTARPTPKHSKPAVSKAASSAYDLSNRNL